MPTTFFQYLKSYIFVYWKTFLVTAVIGILVTGIAVASVAILVALPQFILAHFGEGVQAQLPASSTEMKWSFDLSELTATARGFVDAMEKEYGIVKSILALSIVYLILAIAARSLQAYATCMLMRAKRDTERQTSADLFNHMFTLSIDFFNQRKLGDLTRRIGSDCGSLAQAAFDAIGVIFGAAPLFIFYWIILFMTSWELTLIGVGMFVIRSGVANWISRYLRRLKASMLALSGEVSSWNINVLGNAYVVKAFATEPAEVERYNRNIRNVMNLAVKADVMHQIDDATQAVLNGVVIITVAVAGVLMLLDGVFDVVTLFVFLIAAHRSMDPTQRLLRFIPHVNLALGSGPRVFEITKEKPRVIDGTRQSIEFSKSIVFEGVSFHYSQEMPIANNINFSIPKGKTVAVVGASGSGKSTLSYLLLRFFDPNEGRVLIDGIDIKDFSLETYRSLFGVVPQDTHLMNATIRENIVFGLPGKEASDEAIADAARISHVTEFVDEMPEGFETMIGDRGVRLSGGQKQRISLARAIIKSPEVLILDEATSSLDSESELFIQDAIARFTEERTAFIIAHRLSTILACDKIIVLEEGRISDQGTHNELMQRSDVYQRMYSAQFRAEEHDLVLQTGTAE